MATNPSVPTFAITSHGPKEFGLGKKPERRIGPGKPTVHTRHRRIEAAQIRDALRAKAKALARVMHPTQQS